MGSRTAFLIAGIVLAWFCANARVETQAQSQDVMTALLTEVRALRTTIALVVGAGANGQLALGRLQLQEQRVNALTTRLEASGVAEMAEDTGRVKHGHASPRRRVTNFSVPPYLSVDVVPCPPFAPWPAIKRFRPSSV
jgi:hypothetical protein